MVNFLNGLTVIALLSLAQVTSADRLLKFVEPKLPELEEQYRWNPKLIQAFSLGQVASVVDWFWIKVMADPSITHVPKGTHPEIFYSLDVLTDLDPLYLEAYIFGGQLVSVVRDDGAGAQHLLEKGERFRTQELKNYPKSFYDRFWFQEWVLPFNLGYGYIYETQDFVKAALAFEASSQAPGAHPVVGSLAKKLKTPEGRFEVAYRVAGFLKDAAKDEILKAGYEAQQKNIEVMRFLFELNQDWKSFLKAKRAKPSPVLASQFLKTDRDPVGGKVFLSEQGRFESTTPIKDTWNLED